MRPAAVGDEAGALVAHPSRSLRQAQEASLNGPDQEVYFPQEHPPGREAQIDFTHCNSLGVTIGGRPTATCCSSWY